MCNLTRITNVTKDLISGTRTLTINIPKGHGLFKVGSDQLPLFLGNLEANGDTLTPQDYQAIKPHPREKGETVRDYLDRVREFRHKVDGLEQWFLNVYSPDEASDILILRQVDYLGALEESRLLEVLRYSKIPHYGELTVQDLHGSDLKVHNLVSQIINNITDDPTQTLHPLHVQRAGDRKEGDTIISSLPPEMDGFGFTIDTWNGSTIQVGFTNGKLIWAGVDVVGDDGSKGYSLVNPRFLRMWFSPTDTHLEHERDRVHI